MSKLPNQQGDVLFHRIDSIPSDVKKHKTKIVAYGEHTGHKHELFGDCDVLVAEDGTLYLNVREESIVKHEEHHPQTISPGKYRIGIVKEFDPFEEEIRNVMD